MLVGDDPILLLGGVGRLMALSGGDEEEDTVEGEGSDQEVVEIDSESSFEEEEEEEEENRDVSVTSPEVQAKVQEDAEVRASLLEVVSVEPRARDVPEYGGSHVWVGGVEAPVDAEVERNPGKRAYGDASRSSLPYFANQLGVTDLGAELFTSPDLRECHIQSTEGSAGYRSRLREGLYSGGGVKIG